MKHVVFFLSTELPASQTASWHIFGNYIFDWADREGVKASFVSFSEMVFELTATGDTRLRSPFNNIDVADADFVVFRTIRDHNEQAEETALFLHRHGIPYIDKRVKPNAHGKYSWQVKYAEKGLPFIPTTCGTGRALLQAYGTGMLQTDFPLIVKARQGRQGKDNYLMKTTEDLQRLLMSRENDFWVIQPFIENDGDYRVVVLGDKVTTVIFRQRQKASDTHLNNTSQGAAATQIDPHDLPGRLREDAIAAAQLTGLDVAGVDMMINAASGEHVILEVNGAPQLSSGAFPDEKMRGYTDHLTRLLRDIENKTNIMDNDEDSIR